MPDFYKDTVSELNKECIDVVFLDLVTVVAGDTTLFFTNNTLEPVVFKDNTYYPAVFTVSEPDKNNLEEGSGSLTIAGVTNEYVALLQDHNGDIDVTIGLVREDQLDSGLYVLPPISYRVETVTLNSSTAEATFDLRTGGALGFFVSSDSYSPTEFPGLEG